MTDEDMAWAVVHGLSRFEIGEPVLYTDPILGRHNWPVRVASDPVIASGRQCYYIRVHRDTLIENGIRSSERGDVFRAARSTAVNLRVPADQLKRP